MSPEIVSLEDLRMASVGREAVDHAVGVVTVVVPTP